MLPVNIIANWCSTPATLLDFSSVLEEYVEGAQYCDFRQITYAASWIERTLFTCGDSEWSRNEGSLIFNNKRAVLWRENAERPDQSHLIFIAMFPSSLVHLRQGVSRLMRESRDLKVAPAGFDLSNAAQGMQRDLITGAELINSAQERALYSGSGLFSSRDREGFPFINLTRMLLWLGEETGNSVSKLFLRTTEPQTDISLSRDGVLTFSDTDLTLGEIVDVISWVSDTVPVRAGEGEVAGPRAEAGREISMSEEE